MTAEIRLTKELTPEEWKSLYGWGENIFGVEDLAYSWRPKEWHFVVEEEGRPLAHVGLLKTAVTAGGREVTVAGVGGVVSTPEGRGRRLVHEAMQRAFDFMCGELGVEFGMLFCLERLVAFYARQGWQLVEDEVEIEQPSGKLVCSFRVMVRPCGEGREWPAGRIEVSGLPW